MTQIFTDAMIDDQCFRDGEGELHAVYEHPGTGQGTRITRSFSASCRNAVTTITCRQKGRRDIVLTCPYGDTNLIAHCIASGIDIWNVFQTPHIKQMLIGSTPELLDHTHTGRRLTLERASSDTYTLTVSGRGLSGGPFTVSTTAEHVRDVSSRLLTGTMM